MKWNDFNNFAFSTWKFYWTFIVLQIIICVCVFSFFVHFHSNIWICTTNAIRVLLNIKNRASNANIVYWKQIQKTWMLCAQYFIAFNFCLPDVDVSLFYLHAAANSCIQWIHFPANRNWIFEKSTREWEKDKSKYVKRELQKHRNLFICK